MKKNLVLMIGCSIFAFHLLATFIYLAPANPMTNSYRVQLDRYMSPMFSQNWGLFAPAPAISSMQLLYRCDQGPWLDPISPLYRTHHAFPFTYRGKLTYVYEALVRDLFNDTMKFSHRLVKVNDIYEMMTPAEISKQKSFQDTITAIHDFCLAGARETKSFEFQIIRSYAKDFSKRLTDTTGRKEVVFYPPIKVTESKGDSYASH